MKHTLVVGAEPMPQVLECVGPVVLPGEVGAERQSAVENLVVDDERLRAEIDFDVGETVFDSMVQKPTSPYWTDSAWSSWLSMRSR